MYRLFGKRVLDIIASAIGLLVLSPILLVVMIAVFAESPGSPFFVQKRVGRGGRIFSMIKFRSMVKNASKMGKGYYFDGENDPRITRVGRFLRKSSLDELPELVNVLIGDMSLVGPRPMLPYQYEYLSAEQRRRVELCPGITGLAQITGRNTLPWSKRILLDVEYIDGLNVWRDITLIIRTLTKVLHSEGIDHGVTPEQIEDFIPPRSDDAQ